LHFISSPVHNGAFSSIFDASNGNFNVYWYDESNTSTDPGIGWTRILSGTLTDGLGYTGVYNNWTTRTFSGTLTTSSDIGVTVTNTSSGNSSADGWNLIGNPYPSPVNCSSLVADNSLINGTVYFWDSDTSAGSGYSSADYGTWNGSGSAASGGGQQVAPNGTLAIGQAFFVQKSSVGSGTLYFKNTQRTHTTNAQFFTPDAIDFQRIKLSVSNERGLYNEIIIAFRKEASFDQDRLYDGIKLKGNPNLAFYSIWNNYDHVILSQPELTKNDHYIIPLGLDAGFDVIHQIKGISYENIDSDIKILLEDRKLNKYIDLANSPEYNFTPNSGTDKNRFFLHINPENVSIDEPMQGFSIYSSGKSIYITNPLNQAGKVIITDLLGKTLLTCKIQDINGGVLNINVAKGYYLVNIITSEKSFTQKIFIQ